MDNPPPPDELIAPPVLKCEFFGDKEVHRFLSDRKEVYKKNRKKQKKLKPILKTTLKRRKKERKLTSEPAR